tara:strand:+ start:932 stop:2203 length:1272 start_codon:yes stop_codon:yes gene_type:complete
MKQIKGIILNNTELKSTANNLQYEIVGEIGAFFSLQVVDNSSPNKFYNFLTKSFTTSFSSENVLSNIEMNSAYYSGNITIPASTNGNTYKIMVFADPFFNTKIADTASQDDFVITSIINQASDVTVRFSTSSDQDNSNLVGIGAFIGSTTGTAEAITNIEVNFTETLIDSSTGGHGYKWNPPTSTNPSNSLASNLQPIDSDFFTKQTKETVGSGSSATSMVLNNVNNLVIGMSLVDIESSSVTTTGSLGVLTYPTITAIDTDSKTVTLSSAHNWATNKDVTFRAYGSNLIKSSTGGVFEFNLTVFPESSVTGRLENWGRTTINGVHNGTDLTVDNTKGASVGAQILSPRIANLENVEIIAINAAGTEITVSGTVEAADNTVLIIHGASDQGTIEGTIIIKQFPSISTDVFYDVDRAFVLSTLS